MRINNRLACRALKSCASCKKMDYFDQSGVLYCQKTGASIDFFKLPVRQKLYGS